MLKRTIAIIITLCFVCLTAAGCGQTDDTATAETTAVVTNLPKPDAAKWQYDEDKELYYQLGIGYCETPADEKYEKLAVFVPAAYVDATDNGDGTFTCEVNKSAEMNGYTAASAPIAMTVRTEGYAAAEAITEELMNAYRGIMDEAAAYTSQGFVYVFPGCRGIIHGAPTGVTDLKAAIRYLRYSDDVLAGDAESIFVYGMSGGGAQSAILGATGDSPLYDPYLEAIGAVQGVSDAVCGTMDWCPITDVDTANMEYEWMMGCTRTGRTEEWNAISDKLAYAYADYLNSAGFTDENGKKLTLEESEEGIYQAGSYYDYIKKVIEQSLNNYLSDTELSGQAAQDYIDGLNKDRKWINYDKSTNTATITSVADFCKTCKNASELLVAFDWPNTANTLFGFGDGEGVHFDYNLANVLTELNSEYASEYTEDFKKTDALGCTVRQRLEMYTPLYFLMESRDGYKTAKVAPYWRIRTGIEQPTTSLTTEVNLMLALKNYDGVKDVDFETVWAQGHEPVERTGDKTENFIAWINTCMKG